MNLKQFADNYIDDFRKAYQLVVHPEGLAIDTWAKVNAPYLKVYFNQLNNNQGFSGDVVEDGWYEGIREKPESLSLESTAVVEKIPEEKKELNELLLIDLVGKLIPALERAQAEGQDSKKYEREEVDVKKEDPMQSNKYRVTYRVKTKTIDVLAEDSEFIKRKGQGGAVRPLRLLIKYLNERQHHYAQYIAYLDFATNTMQESYKGYLGSATPATDSLEEVKAPLEERVKYINSTVEKLNQALTALVLVRIRISDIKPSINGRD